MADVPRVLGNWYLGEVLGSGFSGSIFRAKHIYTGHVVALKVQRVDHECPTNRYERAFYPWLQGGVGMPILWASGVEGWWDYLAIDLLGPSLDNLYRASGKEIMDLRSVCCIAMQLITRLEFMHSRGILHRDIQLGNCVIGLPPNETTIYMIDFGFSKPYIDHRTGRHIQDSRVKRDFIGNFWFSSVAVHCKGKVPSRRDDLEAAALMLIHLLTPRGLSWIRHGVPKTDAAHERLKRAKANATPEDLCRGLPQEFEEFLKYCRRLKFQECPDYDRWKEEFRELARQEGFPASDAFIWPPPPVRQQMPLTPRAIHLAKRMPAAPGKANEVENILHDLANLQIGERKVLGDRKNIEIPAVRAKKDVVVKENTGTKPAPIQTPAEPPPPPPPPVVPADKTPVSNEVIEISSGSEDSVPPRYLTPKARQLIKLTKAVAAATDNAGLADAVNEFVVALQSNSSRTLTKEGFGFLDALYKQLADPSVFVVPLRTNRKRSTDVERLREALPRPAKLGVVARLKKEVTEATENGALAKMVSDFGAVTNMGSGRNVTKDGFGFLVGLAKRLKELSDTEELISDRRT